MVTGTQIKKNIDEPFLMLDVWCASLDRPNEWSAVQTIVTVMWIQILKPKFIITGSAKVLNLFERGYFSNIFKKHRSACKSVGISVHFWRYAIRHQHCPRFGDITWAFSTQRRTASKQHLALQMGIFGNRELLGTSWKTGSRLNGISVSSDSMYPPRRQSRLPGSSPSL